MFPKITIITPSFNQARFLEECILSVITQNYPNLEFIVIDGGSEDASRAIIEKYTDRIAYWVSERDMGTFDAINKALKIFSGQYWCVVNSDDALKPGCLEAIANHITTHGYPDWITGDVEYINEKSERLGNSDTCFPAKVAGMYFLNGCWIPHPVTFLSRKLFEEVGEFEETDIMDLAYWIEAEKKGFIPVIIKKELGRFRYHSDSKSMKFVNLQKQILDTLTTKYLSLTGSDGSEEYQSYLKDYRFYVFQMEAKHEIYQKRYLQAIVLISKFLTLNPSHLMKRWPYGMIKFFFKGVPKQEFSPEHMVKEH